MKLKFENWTVLTKKFVWGFPDKKLLKSVAGQQNKQKLEKNRCCISSCLFPGPISPNLSTKLAKADNSIVFGPNNDIGITQSIVFGDNKF